MSNLISAYRELLGSEPIDQLHQVAKKMKGIKIVHINSTRHGGGVAEILEKMVPLTNLLNLPTRWEVIHGTNDFFQFTKLLHNGLQGKRVVLTEPMKKHFEEVNAQNAEELRPILEDADFVFVHDPQPAPIIKHFPKRKGKWIWRCHIDASRPGKQVWQYIRNFVMHYDASIFSLADFAQVLPHPMYLIPPSIDPLSDKNLILPDEEIQAVYSRFNIDPERPMILQVSRFDRFKDPIGVIQAYQMVKRFKPNLQLVLAGGGAPDDPESDIVLKEVETAAKADKDIHILFLPSDAHRTINALQRAATIVLQKSIKEGFGLTVTEALWKKKPVIGGNCGGIKLQVINHYTGFLVNTPEGAAHRIRYLLQNPNKIEELGATGHQFVKDNFLITRHLLEYLIVMFSLLLPENERLEFDW